MDPFVAALLIAVGLVLVLFALIVTYGLLYRRLAPESRLKRFFQRSIVWTARSLRYLSSAYYPLGFALMALFVYLTLAYS